MEFIPLYFRDKVRIINPRGTLAVVTLWSDVEHVYERLLRAGADMSETGSHIAVMGFLHGEGFRYLLRNLLYNPQIETLLVLGNDLSGSYEYITSFFKDGVEVIDGAGVKYASPGIGGDIQTVRVVGTNCVMDGLITLESFDMAGPKPEIKRIEGITDGSFKKAAEYLAGYTSQKRTGSRMEIPVPEIVVGTYPSNIMSHVIVEKMPSDAWRKLVHTIYRFGPEVIIKKGKRRELQNVKVVVEEPEFEPDDVIESCGFTPLAFRKYQEAILSAVKIDDTTYTYGNRLRDYFGVDMIGEIAEKLKGGPDDRACFATTWDNTRDITGKSRPCLATLFFRKMESGRLNLTATFRTHNASNAWLENLYGLMAIQGYACEAAGLERGAITVISHSISLDPGYMDKASMIAEEVAGRNAFREDPNGYFNITTEGEEIVLRHMHGPFELGEYRGRKPEAIQYELYRSLAISDINHAMYVGRQLQKAYRCIRDGETYVQD
jgi:thymidylate synthase